MMSDSRSAKDLTELQKGKMWPTLTHAKGTTGYVIHTTSGIAAYALPGTLQQVKAEEIGLANRCTKFKKSWRRRMALAVTSEPNLKRRLLHKMLQRVRKKIASKMKRRDKRVARKTLQPALRTEVDKVNSNVDHVLKTSGSGLKRPYEKPEMTEQEMREAKLSEIKSGSDNKEVHQFQKRGRWGNCLLYHGQNASPMGPDIVWSKEQVPCEKAVLNKTIGGLRHLRETMSRLAKVNGTGAQIYVALKELLDSNPEFVTRSLEMIGSEDGTAVPKDICEAAEKSIRKVLEPQAPNFQPPEKKEESPVNLSLLSLWVQVARDPDDQPAKWVAEGAPAGLRHPIEDRGVFPVYPKEEDIPEGDPELLETAFEEFTNYAGVDDDPAVATEMKRMLGKRFVRKEATLKGVEKYLGEKPVLSKLGCVKKTRGGKTKSRLVIDTKQSKVTAATKRFERSLLPRALDVTHDVLDLMATAKKMGLPTHLIEFLIADFKDAFFILPNKRSERKWFVVFFRGAYYIFLRTTQGSRGAPLTWARFAALITRLTQSVTDTVTSRINTYVDDPIVAILEPQQCRDTKYAMVLIIWSVLGLPLSLKKAVRGKSVTWTSAIFCPIAEGIIVRIKEELVVDATDMVRTMLSKNLISIKDLKSLTGKLTHCASLVLMLRPFLAELYAAQFADRSNAPKGCIWLKQIEDALLWVRAFLASTPGKLERTYYLSAYMSSGPQVTLELDASPWGLGGVLVIDGHPIAWFASALSTEELDILGIKLGESSAQQTVEALAALVALRAWSHHWKNCRATLRVRSDSVSALVVALKLKTRGRAPGIIAKELALDIAEAQYQPHVAEHIPGVHNVVPDLLSRKFQPHAKYVVPDILLNVEETLLPLRGRSYYKTTKGPPT
jgi:hypothetical protein